MLQLPSYSPGPCFLTPKPRLIKISPLRRCNLSSAFCPGYLLLVKAGQCKISCQMRHGEMDPSVNITDLNKFSDRFSKTEIQSIFQLVQGKHAKLILAFMTSFSLVRLLEFLSNSVKLDAIQQLLYLVKGSPFACISNSVSKPTPLQLDVSLPPFRDIRWNFSRLIYLFNIQLERNIATFFIVLLVSCISFVIIGGFLFYNLRGSKQSLEECFWEAWACLCSSSTHLRVWILLVHLIW